MPCLLCDLGAHEVLLHESPDFLVLKTKFMKGHAERFMIVTRKHEAPAVVPSEVKDRGIHLLHRLARERIGLEKGFIILADRYSTIPDHWHLVCCDTLAGEDYQQVVDTPRTVYSLAHPQGLWREPGETHEARAA